MLQNVLHLCNSKKEDMGKEEKAVIPELLTVRFSKEKNENIIKALRQHQHKNKFKSLNVTIEKVITQALNVK